MAFVSELTSDQHFKAEVLDTPGTLQGKQTTGFEACAVLSTGRSGGCKPLAKEATALSHPYPPQQHLPHSGIANSANLLHSSLSHVS